MKALVKMNLVAKRRISRTRSLHRAHALGGDAPDYEDRGPYIRVWSHYRPTPIMLPQRMVPPMADLRSLVERYAGAEHPLAGALRDAGA